MNEQIFERRIRELSAVVTKRSAPAGAWNQIAARIRAGEVVILPSDSTDFGNRLGSRAVRMAAVFVLVASAAIAALSTDAVRNWIADFIQREPVRESVVAPEPPPEPVPGITETTLLVDASDGRIAIVFVQPATGARIHVRFAATNQLRVHAKGAAAGAQFRSAIGRLTVSNAPAGGEMTITIPTQLDQTSLEVNGMMYLIQDRQQLRILAPRADTVGPEIILPLVTEQ